MDPGWLMMLNREEENILPVQLKVHMLMEQAMLRTRCRAVVEERIVKLEKVVRVHALFAVIEKGVRSTSLRDVELASLRRMAVSEVKNVLYDIADEGAADSTRDIASIYDGLVFTEDMEQDAAKGFAGVDEETLFAPRRTKYRLLMTERLHFLIRKLGIMLDMQGKLEALITSPGVTAPEEGLSPEKAPGGTAGAVKEGPWEGSLATPVPVPIPSPPGKGGEHVKNRSTSGSDTEVETDEDSGSPAPGDQKYPTTMVL
ncbi:unnamed protein product [Discosporangium mesarthrocarpum]